MRRWWGGLRVAGRIARRDARRAKGRTALVAVMVGLPVLAGGTWLTIFASSMATDATYSRFTIGERAQARLEYQCPVRVVQSLRAGFGCSFDEATVELPTVGELERLLTEALGPGTPLVRMSYDQISVESATDARRLTYGEAELAAVVSPAFPVITGELPSRPGEVALTGWAAEELGTAVGGTVEIGDPAGQQQQALVTGILHPFTQGPDILALPGTVPGVVLPDDAPAPSPGLEWFVGGDAPVTWTGVLALNEMGVIARSRAVLADPPAHGAMPYFTEGYAAMEATAPQTAVLLAAAVGVGLLETVLLIGPAFAVGARRSARQLALLAASGADRRDLRRVVLWSGIVIGFASSVVAALLGAAIGVALVTWLPASAGTFPNLVLPWPELLALVGIGTGVAVAAAWLPSRRASRVDVVGVLYGRRVGAPSRRGIPVAGLILLGAGLAGATVGAVRAEPGPVLVGVILMLGGTVAVSGAIVALLGRVARWAPTSVRLALRDAARQRPRTAPAVAAVIAAVAGATVGVMYLEASTQHDAASWAPSAALGVVQVGVDPYGRDPVAMSALVLRAEDAVRTVGPVADSAVLRVLGPAATGEDAMVSVLPELRPDAVCPLWLDAPPTGEQVAELLADPRCAPAGSVSTRSLALGMNQTLVDDGSALRLLGLPGAEQAAAALADGAAVVNRPAALWPDGTVHLRFEVQDTTGGRPPGVRELVLPGHVLATSSDAYRVVLPEGAIAQLDGLGVAVRDVGLVALPAQPWSDSRVDEAGAAVADAVGTAESWVRIERPYSGWVDTTLVAGVSIAAAVAPAATWIAVGLAAAESRADFATLAAIGASPRTRRKVAGAQAGLIACTGVVLGVAAGILLGAVFVLVQRGSGLQADPSWQVVVPWAAIGGILVGLPALAVGAVMLLTRSRLPLVRRIAT